MEAKCLGRWGGRGGEKPGNLMVEDGTLQIMFVISCIFLSFLARVQFFS